MLFLHGGHLKTAYRNPTISPSSIAVKNETGLGYPQLGHHSAAAFRQGSSADLEDAIMLAHGKLLAIKNTVTKLCPRNSTF
jgi:hypothetical protein